MKNFIYLLLLMPVLAFAQAEPASESGLNAIEAAIDASNVILADVEANTKNDGLEAFYIGSTVGAGSDCTTMVIADSGAVVLVKQSIGSPLMYWVAMTSSSSSAAFQILPTRETLTEAKEDLIVLFNAHNETSYTGPGDCSTLNADILGL